MLNIALPKGRLGDQVYELLASVGYDCKSIYDENRKLVFENPQTGVRYLLVKPSDVAIYVEHHAADVGIVGKDILMESNPDVYELLDLGLGKCRMCVAGKEDYVEDKDRPVRVATKFTNIAKEHYAKLGRDIDIIKLNGSIELAPILGLSDVIVDIVESGSTIRENHLKVLEEFLPISARFIANKSSFEFKNQQITEMAEKLKGAVEAHQKKKEQEKKEKEVKENAEKETAAEDKKEAQADMSRFLSKASESLLPYTPGEQPQGRKFIKLNTNECPYPPSPKVAEAILAGYEENSSKIMPLELANLRLYSDPEERVLIEAIADHYGVGTNQVIAGNGSDEILGFAFRAFCDQNAPLQFADLTYGFYPALCGLYGIPFKVVPLEEDFTLNIEPYKNCGNNVIIANPNAPTGMNLPLSAIEEVAASNPDRVVMVDEAYVDFGGESCVSLLPKYENLVIIQTFSKSRSLAGARVGFAIANPELIADMNRIKYSFNPYNVNRLSILAGAAAMRDWDYTKECTGRICKTREKTTEALRALGFTVLDSKTNFIFAKSGDMPGKVYFDGLREAGILVRRWDSERIKDYVRISIGSEEEMETFVEETKKLVEAARSAVVR